MIADPKDVVLLNNSVYAYPSFLANGKAIYPIVNMRPVCTARSATMVTAPCNLRPLGANGRIEKTGNKQLIKSIAKDSVVKTY